MSTTSEIDGTETPRPTSPAAATDLNAMRNSIVRMNSTFATLRDTFGSLSTESAQMTRFGPTKADTLREVDALRHQLTTHEATQRSEIEATKVAARDELKEKIAKRMQAAIKEQIRAEITKQVHAQVDAEINQYLPVSLQKQSEENQEQIAFIRHSLFNSEARSFNAHVWPIGKHLDDELKPLLKPDGQPSTLFPADLRSLLHYDEDSLRELMGEYDLVSDTHEANLSRFKAHIGLPII